MNSRFALSLLACLVVWGPVGCSRKHSSDSDPAPFKTTGGAQCAKPTVGNRQISEFSQSVCEDEFGACLHYDPSKDKTFITSPIADLTDKKVRDQLFPSIKTSVEKVLAADLADNGDIMAGSVTYFHLSSDPDCEKKNSKYSSRCLDKVTDITSRYILASTLGKEDKTIQNGPDGYQNSVGRREFTPIYQQAETQLQKLIDVPELQERVSQVFNDIKIAFAEVINSNVPDPELREIMRQRIKSVPLNFKTDAFHCDSYDADNAAYSKFGDLKTVYDVEEIQPCHGFYMKGINLGKMIFILAHELAHSIDTCRMEQVRSLIKSSGEYPVPGLVNCLAGPMSVGICAMDNAQASICRSNSQSIEAVPDWWATEVLNRMLSQEKDLSPDDKQTVVAGVAAQMCVDYLGMISTAYSVYNMHPPLERRLNFILMANPALRTQLSCSSAKEVKYCPSH